jgi:hypothetical protein
MGHDVTILCRPQRVATKRILQTTIQDHHRFMIQKLLRQIDCSAQERSFCVADYREAVNHGYLVAGNSRGLPRYRAFLYSRSTPGPESFSIQIIWPLRRACDQEEMRVLAF